MERSRKLVLTDWTKANDALNLYFEGNKSKLTAHVGMSRTTVTAFFKSGPVREAEFRKLCFALRLNWQEVSTVQTVSAENFANAAQPENKTDSLQQLREHCRQKILSQHSRMRLLSGEEIGVDQLYVDVWVLNRSPRSYQVSLDKLLQTFDLRNDRLGLGDRIKRNPGFEIANANAKLLILGKPGAGKTTFLKHLAVDWCKGQFQSDLVAVFIEFRRVRDREWQLLDAIGKELGLDEGPQIRALKQQIEQLKQSLSKSSEEERQKNSEIKAFQEKLEALALQILLKEGNFLVLMDGLDEVPNNELRRNVQEQLREVAEEYANNRWILTCRTQIIASIPDGFASVEVADFSPEQVQQFVQNWFQANGQANAEVLRQWEIFDNAVSKNLALKELAVTPVLLSLMCLVFHDEGEMPSQMTDLYKRGIRLLLERWNDAKAIENWEVGVNAYRQLSVEQKEALLIEIAARKFENPKNFVLFQQDEIATQIADFIHLANHEEGVAVLEAMEAQHGLLIERADELWSFSHLTFQEHFTVQWLTQLPSEQLAEKISNSQWQQVVEQLVRSQQPADRLLRLIKQAVDQSIAREPAIQTLLSKLLKKLETIRTNKNTAAQTNKKTAAIRVFYYSLTLDLDLNLAQALTRDLDLDLARIHARTRALDLDLIIALALDFTHPPNLDITRTRNLDITLDRALAITLDRAKTLAKTLAANARNLDLERAKSLIHALEYTCTLTREPDLTSCLRQLIRELPVSNHTRELQRWWQLYGDHWIEKLGQVMIKHRNIGHNRQFNQQQQQQLQRYYDANCFLVKMIKIEGAASQETRSEIENSLLLPWDELQRCYPETYSSHPP